MNARDHFVDQVLDITSISPCEGERQQSWSDEPNYSEAFFDQTTNQMGAYRSEVPFFPTDIHDSVESPYQKHEIMDHINVYLPTPLRKVQINKKINISRRKASKKQAKKPRIKNVLINFSTGLRKFVKSRVNRSDMAAFEELFGSRKEYKGMERFTQLFQSNFYELCVEFFDFHVLRSLIRSNVSRKASLIKYLGVMRQAVLKKELTCLEAF